MKKGHFRIPTFSKSVPTSTVQVTKCHTEWRVALKEVIQGEARTKKMTYGTSLYAQCNKRKEVLAKEAEVN